MARILIVDDLVIVVKVLKGVLTRQGHEVLTATDGAMALDILSEDSVDLVITDMIMPKMNGVELIAALQMCFPDLNIIAMSSGDDERGPYECLKEAREAGVCRSHCLVKPFQLREFSALVNKLVCEQVEDPALTVS